MSQNIIILVGRSGSGKGTQGEFIKKFVEEKAGGLPVRYISTGERFRSFAQSGTYSSLLSKKVNDAGKLQPEFLAVWNWSSILIDELKEPTHIIFDGAPRKRHEAEVLNSCIDFYDWKMPIVIEIDVSLEECTKRLLSRKRGDDTEEIIRERLSWYDKDVIPMLDWYKTNEKYIFKKIDGMRSVEEISVEIRNFLSEYIK